MGTGPYFRKVAIYIILTILVLLIFVFLHKDFEKDFQYTKVFINQNFAFDGISDFLHIGVISQKDELYNTVRTITSNNQPVLVTLTNKSSLPFALNWLCNTKLMDVHKQTLFLTTDKESKLVLSKLWPEVNVYNLGVGKEEHQTFSQIDYDLLMALRTQILMKILEMKREILLFGVNSFWVKNPIPELKKNNDVDVLVTPETQTHNVTVRRCLYLFPTEATINFWRELTKRMTRLGEKIKLWKGDKPVPDSYDDQMYVSDLLEKQYAGIRTRVLSADVFPDGKWYGYSTEVRQTTHPLIINNNLAVGNYRNLNQTKEWKHWFINDDNTCIGDIRKTNEHLL